MFNAEVNMLRLGFFDHYSIRLDLKKECRNVHKAFTFFNHIFDHPEFINKVKVSW